MMRGVSAGSARSGVADLAHHRQEGSADHTKEAHEGEERDHGDHDPADELDHEATLGTCGRLRRRIAEVDEKLLNERRQRRAGDPHGLVVGDVEHRDGLGAAGGGGDQRGEAGAALEPGRAEGSSRSRAGPRGSGGDVRPPGAGDEVPGDERVAERAAPVAGEQRGHREHGHPASTQGAAPSRTATHAGPGRHKAGTERPGPAAPDGARAVPDERGVDGLRAVEHLAGDALDDDARAGGTSVELPCCLRSSPVTMAESRAPRATRRPRGSDRFRPATRSSSSVVSRVVNRPRVRCQVPRTAGAGQAEAPVGHEVPADREHAKSR